MLSSQAQRKNIVKMSTLPTVVYRFDEKVTKILVLSFIEIEKKNPKMFMELNH